MSETLTSEKSTGPDVEKSTKDEQSSELEAQETEKTEDAQANTAEEEDSDELQPLDESIVDDWKPEKVLEKIRKNNNELRSLRARAKAAETKVAELEASAPNQTNEIATLKSQVLRYEVALEKGLPAALVPRLQGNTRDEIIEDANSLTELMTGTRPPSNRPDAPGSLPAGDLAAEDDLSKIAQRMFKR